MKIIIKAKPNSKEDKVEKIDEANYIVSVKEAPTKGRANQAIIEILADYFGIKPYFVRIISGHWSKTKVIEIIT